MYEYYNANPKGRDIADCVLRAISVLENRDWLDVYRELSHISGLDGYMFDNVEFVEDYLDDRYKRECHYSKTVGEFAREYPNGRYAITMDGHITALIDGVVVDTFDCRNRVMRCAWKIK